MKNMKMLALALCLLLLTGCGSGGNQQLDTFHNNMDSFYDSLSTTVSVLESIDPQSETAVDEMLAQLDSMTVLFESLASMEYPEPFESIQETASEASEYIATAAELYHEAYADGNYDDSLAEAAAENYARAMKRINYVAILLQGRYPEDENVTIVSEPDEPDWNGGEGTAPSE